MLSAAKPRIYFVDLLSSPILVGALWMDVHHHGVHRAPTAPAASEAIAEMTGWDAHEPSQTPGPLSPPSITPTRQGWPAWGLGAASPLLHTVGRMHAAFGDLGPASVPSSG